MMVSVNSSFDNGGRSGKIPAEHEARRLQVKDEPDILVILRQ
jgi:hypothetical protein